MEIKGRVLAWHVGDPGCHLQPHNKTNVTSTLDCPLRHWRLQAADMGLCPKCLPRHSQKHHVPQRSYFVEYSPLLSSSPGRGLRGDTGERGGARFHSAQLAASPHFWWDQHNARQSRKSGQGALPTMLSKTPAAKPET